MSTNTASKSGPSASGGSDARNGAKEASNGQANPFAAMMSTWMSPNAFQSGSAENMTAFSEASTAMMKGTMGLFQETSRFVSDRLTKDLGAMQAFGGCRSPEDIFRVQAEFFDTAIRDYSDEASKVAQIAAETTRCTCEPLQERTTAVLHDMQGKEADA